MATVKGEYNYISEILKGTSGDDNFILGSGDEYLFGGTGFDVALVPSTFPDDPDTKFIAGFYYIGLGIAVIGVKGTINPIDIYYFDGIEYIIYKDGAGVDLREIDNLNGLERFNSWSSAIQGFNDNSNESLVGYESNNNTFFPGEGDATVTGNTGVDTLYLNYSYKLANFALVNENTTEIKIDINGILKQKIVLKNIEYIIFPDNAFFRDIKSNSFKEYPRDLKVDFYFDFGPTYTLTPSASSFNEGSTLTTSVATTNVESGTTLYYSLSGTGITTSDFSSGLLTGSGTVSSSGSFTFSHTLSNDITTEGTESLNIKLFSDSARSTQVGSTASVSIIDTSFALTYYNPNTANTLASWNIYRVDNLVKAGDIVSQWFGTAAPATQQIQDISDTKLMDVVATTWADKVQINRVVKATDSGGRIEARQINLGSGEVAGSVISGGKGNDDIKGFAGWDIIDGGAGDDLIHGGNGRDNISGGGGRDELHGDFGWNTYRSEKDGASDLIAIKSDHYLVNWLYGKAGNSPNGEKADIIEGLDSIDKIKLIGIDTREITFAANISAKGVTGIGIYGKGILEALYTGGDLTVAQITQMTSGDASAAAMSNSVNAYGVW